MPDRIADRMPEWMSDRMLSKMSGYMSEIVRIYALQVKAPEQKRRCKNVLCVNALARKKNV